MRSSHFSLFIFNPESVWEQDAEENISTSEAVMGSWGKLHNEQHHNLYPTPYITKALINDKMAGTYSTHEKYKIIVGEPEGKRSLGRYRCRRETSVKMYIEEKGHGDVKWTDLLVAVISIGLL
jgi:hypothetical protein